MDGSWTAKCFPVPMTITCPWGLDSRKCARPGSPRRSEGSWKSMPFKPYVNYNLNDDDPNDCWLDSSRPKMPLWYSTGSQPRVRGLWSRLALPRTPTLATSSCRTSEVSSLSATGVRPGTAPSPPCSRQPTSRSWTWNWARTRLGPVERWGSQCSDPITILSKGQDWHCQKQKAEKLSLQRPASAMWKLCILYVVLSGTDSIQFCFLHKSRPQATTAKGRPRITRN